MGTTVFNSDSRAQLASVNGRTLTITTFNLNQPAYQLTLDINGNLGLHGSYHSASSRALKKDIHPFSENAVDLLGRTRIVTYRYRDEPETSTAHVGIIAEDAPVPLTDPGHRSFDLNTSLAVTIAAEHQLNERIRRLEGQVRELKAKH